MARKLFEDAVRFEREQRWELAASKLNDAIAVKDTPGLRFHLAHCEDKLGHLVEAMIHYDHARELLASGVKAPDVEEVLEPARKNLELRLPTLLLVVPAEVPDVQVELDGRVLARSVIGRAAPVNPGIHKLLVRAPGHVEYAEEVSILEGERRRISVDLPRAPSTSSAQTETPVKGGSVSSRAESSRGVSARTVVLVGETAVTLAALGVGVGFLIAKSGAADRVRRAQAVVDDATPAGGGATACLNPPSMAVKQACSELDDAAGRYDTARHISTFGLVGASVGAAATLLTLVLWPSSPVTAEVNASSGSAFLGVSGRF
ncbi:MAG TPA: hypothetical protein VFQ35_23110 [Polyangiaceae bacterium]|nr:hypothetical protein [Polyangiaceae bacterium]